MEGHANNNTVDGVSQERTQSHQKLYSFYR